MQFKRIKNIEPTKTKISLYTSLPEGDIDYETFKGHAINRIKILRRIESRVNDHYYIKYRHEDIMQHFCLKLVCSQTKWALNWFINLETDLFYHRINRKPDEAKILFTHEMWPCFRFSGDKIDYYARFDPQFVNDNDFSEDYKIHFSKVPDILSKRKQELSFGYFNFNFDVMKSLLVNEFRENLEREMLSLYEKCSHEPDERLQNLNTEIFMYKKADEDLHSDILNKTESFPLCVRGIIEILKTKKHLKYNDRNTLSLFFKDLGMPINDTVDFFRSNFNCTPEKFNKEYLYSIRHNYGLEGKRANYNSFSCQKIASFSADNNSFGCPYVNNKDFLLRYMDIEDLDKDPLTSCANFGAKITRTVIEPPRSPADFFRKVENTKK